MRFLSVILLVIAINACLIVASDLKLFFDQKFDFNGDDMITKEEFSKFIGKMDPGHPIPTVEMIEPFFRIYDQNADGLITWNEFYSQLSSLDTNTSLPQQMHLALNNDPSQMVISWAQDVPDSDMNSLVVQYGVVPGVYTSSATAAGHKYSVDNNIWTSLPLLVATMTGLPARTRIYYRVGSDKNGWSAECSFLSAPSATMKNEDLHARWLIYGDMGTVAPMGKTVTDWILLEQSKNPFDITIHLGDLAYAGVNSWGELEPVWDIWMNQISAFAKYMPYQVTVGNHEHYFNFTAYMNRFAMPGNQQAGGNGNFWYSMNFGDVHYLSFDTEANYTAGSPQWNFIKNDLAAARANPNIKWIFFGGHRPLLSSDTDGYDNHKPGADMLTQLEPLLLEYEVDLVLVGHEHCYERTYPYANGQVVPSGKLNGKVVPIYITQGTAGAMIIEEWVWPKPEWSAVRLLNYGYGVVTFGKTADGKSSLHYEYKSTENAYVIDEFWLYK